MLNVPAAQTSTIPATASASEAAAVVDERAFEGDPALDATASATDAAAAAATAAAATAAVAAAEAAAAEAAAAAADAAISRFLVDAT